MVFICYLGMVMLQTFNCSTLANLEKVSRDTIKRRTDKYLAIRFDSYESKRKSSKGYSVRYARVNDVLDSILK
jgi:hypothetical protein